MKQTDEHPLWTAIKRLEKAKRSSSELLLIERLQTQVNNESHKVLSKFIEADDSFSVIKSLKIIIDKLKAESPMHC